ncbi:hypothetical protein LOK49_LG03G03408 [Camellia lanceoleosa]|uniref:Uncharacterized protein n=1 Tax=Camellia lanceoleosa TaxID=1840588 RepID=A0ACC0IGT4_9ERIC|nr:hypothetical protein LOK49_LG03G03408 [Camellia lanceoleosa]
MGQYFQNPNHSWAASDSVSFDGELEYRNALVPSPFRGTIQFDIGGHRVTCLPPTVGAEDVDGLTTDSVSMVDGDTKSNVVTIG